MAFNKAKAMQEAESLVSQRKISEAIKKYQRILEKEPADVSLLNTIGDLYFRENNKAEALNCFNRLADAFTRDGFTVKAIAIYKKIVKIDPSSVEPILKMAELYILQGLNREARDQYNQAVAYFKKKNLPDRALETYRKIVALDPENRTYHTRLAELAEQLGQIQEASRAYLDVAESALREGDSKAAEAATKKALEIDPKSSEAQLLRARLASSKQDYAQAEKILDSVPRLKDSPAGRQLLLGAYLATQRMDAAERLVVDVFQSNPDDFSPLGAFADLCLEQGNVDAAVIALGAAADLLIDRKGTAPLMETLRQIWAKNPAHVDTLELVLRVAERTGDEATLPEVLGALGSLYEQAGDLEKAEGVYSRLVQREPVNEEYRALLKRVLERQGKETEITSPAALAGLELEIPGVQGAPAPAPAEDDAQAKAVKEALENSDLFSRYGLIDKAVAELEKALASYPEQVEIHRRIFEVCHRNQPARASQAAEALARIYQNQGDLENARKYVDLINQLASGVPGVEVTLPAAGAARIGPQGASGAEVDISEAAALVQEEVPKTEEPSPVEIPFDLSPRAESPAPPPASQELDLSADLAAFTGEPAAVEPPPDKAVVEAPAEGAAPFNYGEARMEVEFYLSQGFLDEASNAIQTLESKFPGEPQLAELRRMVEAQTGAPATAPAAGVPREVEIAPAAVEPLPAETIHAAPPVQPPPEEAPSPAAGGDLLGDLAGELAEGFEGLGEPAAGQKGPAPGGEEASPLSGLLDELGETGPAAAEQDDAETHYNLGVAFREMGLLDEAIGEFQKVVKGAQKDRYPPNFLQACSLLAVSFMDKGMPQIAARWYARALETPDLDDESTLALQYDLGVAFEQSGDTRNALERFSEVYSQNIDYRDVAEKIRALQQKAP